MATTLTQSSVASTLFRMAYPMLAGTIALNAYNFVDTWFVARLGTTALAAMGLTFPVVMLLSFIASGIGTGVTALTSHALGRHDNEAASRIVTHGIILIMVFSLVLSICGYLSMDPVFRLIGADEQTMPLVKEYMGIWYCGAVFMAIPMMGNGILISLGDSRSASLFMLSGALLNCILDPVFIFGLRGFPAMGIFGAALATVLSQAFSACWLFYLLAIKYRLLVPAHPRLSSLPQSCSSILRFAIPGSLSMMLMPLSTAVITGLVSRHGNAVIAAVSAAGRVEMVAFVIPMALGMSLMPFVSQNFGAGHFGRIIEAKRYAIKFALIYGAGVAMLLFIFAPQLAGIFTKNAHVAEFFIRYLRIIAFGYGCMEVHRYCGFVATGIHRPVYATIINAIRVLVLLLPLSFTGNSLYGISGIFTGRLITDILAGIIGMIIVSRLLGRLPSSPDTSVIPLEYHKHNA